MAPVSLWGPSFPHATYNDGVFDISEEHGFLPSHHPPGKLPDEFALLQSVIDEMLVSLACTKWVPSRD